MAGGSGAADEGEAGEGYAGEWRSHWRVVVGSGLAVTCGFAPFAYVASQFVQPLERAFGWSRGTQALVQNIYLLAALLTPVLGHYVDQLGVRRIALVAVPALALCYFALALTPGSLTYWLAMMGVLVLVGQGTTGAVFTRAVVTWFNASRGLALAVSRAGVSIAAALLPATVFAAIRAFGWRGGYVALGLLALCVAWPLTIAWVHEKRTGPRQPASMRRRYGPLLRNPRVLLLCLALALTIGPLIGIISQLQPILTGKGVPAGVAASLAGVLALAVLAGTVISGALIDRVWAPLLGCLFTLAPAVGCVLLLAPVSSTAAAALCVVLIGVANGAELDYGGYMIARYFGLRDFAAIFGLSIMAIGLASALFSLAFGVVYDRTGSYAPVLMASAVVLVAAALLTLAMGPYPRDQQEV